MNQHHIWPATWMPWVLAAALLLPQALHAQHAEHAPVHAASAAAPASSGAAQPQSGSKPAPKPAAKPRSALAMGAAFSPSGELWVVGLNERGQLTARTSADEGQSWSPERLIETAGDTPAADGENRPKIAFGPQGWVAITYTQPLAQPYTGQIRLIRSADGGRSFAEPVTVHRDRQIITHRFEAMGFDARGTLHTVWIDKRDLLRAPKGSYRGAAIYRNESTDGGKNFGPDIKLADHSCECCRMALAPTPEGGMAALWRHVFAPNERDHGFALLQGEPAAPPVRATLDRWALDACPHHGPGLTPAAHGGYHAVWFGVRDGVGAVRYGRLSAQGAPQGPVQVLPDARAEHADVISAGRQVAIVWRSFDGEATRWRAWVSADEGAHFTLRELGHTPSHNDHPRLARRGERLYALWRTAEGVRVERL